MFRLSDLECHTKEAFFNGLRPEYRAMVVHKRDNPDITIMQLLTTVRECEENEENNRRNRQAEYAKAYPPSSTSRPTYGVERANPHSVLTVPQVQGRYGRQDKGHVPIHTAHVESAQGAAVDKEYAPPYSDFNDNNPN